MKKNKHYKACPCNIQRIYSAVKTENFVGKILNFSIFLLKILIAGTEAVLTSTRNLCFGLKIRKKIDVPLHTPFFLKKKLGLSW